MPCPMSGPNPSSPAAASAPDNAHHERPSRRTAGRQRHRQDPEQHPGDSTRHGVHAAVIARAAGGEGKPHGRNRARAHHSGTFRLMQRLAGPSLSLNTGPCISRRRITAPHDRHRRTGRPGSNIHRRCGMPQRTAVHLHVHGTAQGRYVPPEPTQAPFPSPGSGNVAVRPRDGRVPPLPPGMPASCAAGPADAQARAAGGAGCGRQPPDTGRCAHGQGRSTNAPPPDDAHPLSGALRHSRLEHTGMRDESSRYRGHGGQPVAPMPSRRTESACMTTGPGIAW